jgi:hypothetical protein|nr:MAG TPA: hypothetical protein [Caudoviricetes sp.]
MDIGINEVKDMIESLESNGELSIKEEKYLKVAKLCVQLADDNAGMVEALEKAQQLIDEPIPSSRNILMPALDGLSRDHLIVTIQTAVDNYSALHAKWLEDRQRIAELESRTVTAAAAAVLAERKRQVTTEGWTPEHDDQHVNFEMAIAGGLYAISAVDSHHKLRNSAPSAWPWDRKWWKPDGPRRDLVKAGALILAEIERLDRAAGIKVEAE